MTHSIRSSWIVRSLRFGSCLALSAAGCTMARAPKTARSPAGDAVPGSPAADAAFVLSDFEDGALSSSLGPAWRASTDAIAGGGSVVSLSQVVDESRGGVMEITGRIDPVLSYAWAGAMLTPGGGYRTPADLSAWTTISFWARGDGGTYRVLLLTGAPEKEERRSELTFVASRDWAPRSFPLAAFDGAELSNVRGILVTASVDDVQSDFDFAIDDVTVRRRPGGR